MEITSKIIDVIREKSLYQEYTEGMYEVVS
jgi:hypothetical protein